MKKSLDLNFLATESDMRDLLDFLFSSTDVRVFESYSEFGSKLREFKSADELAAAYPLGQDLHGHGHAILLQLWSPSALTKLDIRRIALLPQFCNGHTFRYNIEGAGLIRLYFGGVHKDVLTMSNVGHGSQKWAESTGSPDYVDWEAHSKLSGRIQYHIGKRLAVGKVSSVPVLTQALAFARSGHLLKYAADHPWEIRIGDITVFGETALPEQKSEKNESKKVKRKRLSLEKTWQKLEEDGNEMPRTEKGKPFVSKSMPNYDDEELGMEFFRTEVVEEDYGFLTLPKTFFGRSELNTVDFQNTNLSESRMCWNDFIDCDFSNADLSKCDMRASNFDNCNFSGANMKEADLRRSLFTNCNFSGAVLIDVVALPASHTCHKSGGSLTQFLTDEQSKTVAWNDSEGDEPPGG